jgi:hypothetical protein
VKTASEAADSDSRLQLLCVYPARRTRATGVRVVPPHLTFSLWLFIANTADTGKWPATVLVKDSRPDARVHRLLSSFCHCLVAILRCARVGGFVATCGRSPWQMPRGLETIQTDRKKLRLTLAHWMDTESRAKRWLWFLDLLLAERGWKGCGSRTRNCDWKRSWRCPTCGRLLSRKFSSEFWVLSGPASKMFRSGDVR